MARLAVEFGLAYFATVALLWGLHFVGVVPISSFLTLALSFAGLLAAIALTSYRHGLRTGDMPGPAINVRATVTLFATLLFLRSLLEAGFLALAVRQSGLAALSLWTERWAEPLHYIRLAVTFVLALLAIRILFPLACWAGARKAAQRVFS